jgi:hypothetical protein
VLKKTNNELVELAKSLKTRVIWILVCTWNRSDVERKTVGYRAGKYMLAELLDLMAHDTLEGISGS